MDRKANLYEFRRTDGSATCAECGAQLENQPAWCKLFSLPMWCSRSCARKHFDGVDMDVVFHEERVV